MIPLLGSSMAQLFDARLDVESDILDNRLERIVKTHGPSIVHRVEQELKWAKRKWIAEAESLVQKVKDNMAVQEDLDRLNALKETVVTLREFIGSVTVQTEGGLVKIRTTAPTAASKLNFGTTKVPKLAPFDKIATMIKVVAQREGIRLDQTHF
jgi:hypothetical protein